MHFNQLCCWFDKFPLFQANDHNIILGPPQKLRACEPKSHWNMAEFKEDKRKGKQIYDTFSKIFILLRPNHNNSKIYLNNWYNYFFQL